MKNTLIVGAVGLVLVGSLPGADPEWGRMTADGPYRTLTVREWPSDRMLPIETPFPNVVSAWVEQSGRRSIHWMFNPDATRMAIGLPALKTGEKPPVLRLLTTERTTEHQDGTVVLSALDARVIGTRARLETHPGNHRIGYWTDPTDRVEWNFETKGHGHYDVEITFSRSGPTGARLILELDDQALPITLSTTGNWYVYTGQEVGRMEIAGAGRHVARVRCVDPVGGAVMNLKAVLLRPRP